MNSIFEKLYNKANSRGADFKHDQSFFKIAAQNTQIRFFLYETLQLETFEGVNFEYHNSFFKFQPENTQIRQFWFQI